MANFDGIVFVVKSKENENKPDSIKLSEEIAGASLRYMNEILKIADKYKVDRNKVALCACSSLFESCNVFDFSEYEFDESKDVKKE